MPSALRRATRIGLKADYLSHIHRRSPAVTAASSDELHSYADDAELHGLCRSLEVDGLYRCVSASVDEVSP